MPFDPYSEPDPTGSPNEKLKISRRTPAPRDFASFLQREGVDSSLARRIGNAVNAWRHEMHFEDVETLIDMEMWGNRHTHPGSGGGGGSGSNEGEPLINWNTKSLMSGTVTQQVLGTRFRVDSPLTVTGAQVFIGTDIDVYLSLWDKAGTLLEQVMVSAVANTPTIGYFSSHHDLVSPNEYITSVWAASSWQRGEGTVLGAVDSRLTPLGMSYNTSAVDSSVAPNTHLNGTYQGLCDPVGLVAV